MVAPRPEAWAVGERCVRVPERAAGAGFGGSTRLVGRGDGVFDDALSPRQGNYFDSLSTEPRRDAGSHLDRRAAGARRFRRLLALARGGLLERLREPAKEIT